MLFLFLDDTSNRASEANGNSVDPLGAPSTAPKVEPAAKPEEDDRNFNERNHDRLMGIAAQNARKNRPPVTKPQLFQNDIFHPKATPIVPEDAAQQSDGAELGAAQGRSGKPVNEDKLSGSQLRSKMFKGGRREVRRDGNKYKREKREYDRNNAGGGTHGGSGSGSGSNSAAPIKGAKLNSFAKGVGTSLLAAKADEYLHVGRRLGDALFIIWILIAINGLGLFYIGAVIGLFMLALLSIWPKANYTITVLILDLFGVGEALHVANRFGLKKVNIRLATWQHVVVWMFIAWWAVMLLILTTVFVLSMGWFLCTTTGLGQGGFSGAVAGAVLSAYDWWNSTNVGSVAADFCQYINQTGTTGVGGGGGDFGGAGSGGTF